MDNNKTIETKIQTAIENFALSGIKRTVIYLGKKETEELNSILRSKGQDILGNNKHIDKYISPFGEAEIITCNKQELFEMTSRSEPLPLNNGFTFTNRLTLSMP